MHKVRVKLTVDREPRPVSGPRSIILSDGMRSVNLQTGTGKSNARRAAAQFNNTLQATRDGVSSSASRFTLVGPACLSSDC
jgi:hypothetical protein